MICIRQNEFEEVIRRHVKLIFSVCFSITGDYFESEDLTQETFIAASKHIEAISPVKDNIKAWLVKIAVNKSKDYLKSKKYSNRILAEELTDNLPSSSNPALSVESAEITEKIAQIIDNLKEPYKSIAYSHYLSGISIAAYAREQDINEKTAQTRLMRARNKIKKEFRKEYGGEKLD